MSWKSTHVNTAIRTIDCQLDNGQCFRRIANVVKPSQSAVLTKVDIVTTALHMHPRTGNVLESKSVKIIDTRRALEEAIIDRNKAHFAQADGTSYTQEPLCRIGSSNEYSMLHDKDGHETRVPEDYLWKLRQ
jgi:hypothetical protein